MTQTPYFVFLPDRTVLKVSGADAEGFLQGLFSCDVKKAKEGHATLGALLSPQGKFLFDFFLLKHGDEYFLDIHTARAEEFLRKLRMYKLRAAVELSLVASWKVAAVIAEHAPASNAVLCARDGRHLAMGWRLYGEALTPPDIAIGTWEEYETLRLSLGLPDGERDAVIDKTILLENGYDQMGGVDFAKGCYVGQEVTARSKHRGELRKYLCIIRSLEDLPAAGAPIHAGDKVIGDLRSSQGGLGLALVRTDMLALARAEKSPLTLGGKPVEISAPWWHNAA